MFDFLFSIESLRKRRLAKAPKGALRDFLARPNPASTLLFTDIPMLAVDFETTGLDCKEDKLLSIGFVEVTQGRIKLATAKHFIINSPKALNADNVKIHQITDQEKSQGVPLEFAITELLKALSGKVMLVHYAKIEITFLAEACQQLFNCQPIYPVIDTLLIAKRRLDQRQAHYDPSELRLSALRNTFELPGHFAHNALNDAVATAELLLAEVAHKSSKIQLKDLLK